MGLNVDKCCIITLEGVVSLAVVRKNITLDPAVLDRFLEIAEKKGIKLSPWINQKMKEFIQEEDKSKKKEHP